MSPSISNNPMSTLNSQASAADFARQAKPGVEFAPLLDQEKAQSKANKAESTIASKPAAVKLPNRAFIPINTEASPIALKSQDDASKAMPIQRDTIKPLSQMRPSLDTRHLGQTDEQVLRKKVEEFVAAAFISPLMASARDSSLGSDRFSGGYGEDVFRSQLDQQLSGEVTASHSNGLVDAIISRITGDYKSMARSVDRSA